MTSRIVEYVRQGLTSATIDLVIQEEDFDTASMQWTRTVYDTAPDRVVARLTPVDASGADTGDPEVTLDSAALGGIAAGQKFEWDAAGKRLILRWADLVPGTLPTGRYRLDLDWYDPNHTGGVRLGLPGQTRLVIVE